MMLWQNLCIPFISCTIDDCSSWSAVTVANLLLGYIHSFIVVPKASLLCRLLVVALIFQFIASEAMVVFLIAVFCLAKVVVAGVVPFLFEVVVAALVVPLALVVVIRVLVSNCVVASLLVDAPLSPVPSCQRHTECRLVCQCLLLNSLFSGLLFYVLQLCWL